MNDLDVGGGVPARANAQGPVLAAAMRSLGSGQIGALLTLASALTLGVGLILWTAKPDYVPVSNQGSRQDALQIVEMLQGSQTPYKLDPRTGLVLVPSDMAAEVRMNLAASGFSDQRAVGLESLQKDASLGTSHFTQTARYQHALETELGRTISSMRNVESARVHLALPKQSVFVRDREQASASVMIKPMVGRSVEEEQVSAVVNLVASSIPYLDSGQVTIVDQWGRLLSSSDDGDSAVTRGQFQYARKLEKLYASRIESLLTPTIGRGGVRAIVTAEVDFSTNERTEESFESDPTQLRSEETQQQTNQLGAAVGIPGALTNQPPGNGTTEAPGDAEGAATDVGAPVNKSSTELRNYELDKTITHVRQAPGGIRRITAAVIIDDKSAIAEDGTVERTPLSEAELAEYSALVREAIGFDAERGDSVVVFNRSFQPTEEIPAVEPLPLWEQSWAWTMVRQVLTGLAVLLLILMVVRPAMKRLFLQQTPAQGAHAGGERLVASGGAAALGSDGFASADGSASAHNASGTLAAPSAVYGDILNMARAMAAEDPKRVAKVVKDWVGK